MSKITSYKQIENFAACAGYRVTVEWNYLQTQIAHYQERHDGLAALDLNPDFQRGHAWTRAQQIAYVEYILRGGCSGKELYFNCVGWQRDYQGPFVIVDGKQRLTAVLAFLSDEIPAFGSLRSEFTDHIPSEALFMFNMNNLATKEEVLRWYIQMNEGSTPHGIEEINRVKELLKGAAR